MTRWLRKALAVLRFKPSCHACPETSGALRQATQRTISAANLVQRSAQRNQREAKAASAAVAKLIKPEEGITDTVERVIDLMKGDEI